MEFTPAILDKFPVSVEQQVQWGEMDAFNHVNHTIYLRYFEAARIKFLEESGIMELMEKEHIGPILGRIDANYRIPLTFPDTIKTHVCIKSIGNTSFVVQHVVWSEAHQAVACYGDGLTVLIDYDTQQKSPISPDLREIMERYIR